MKGKVFSVVAIILGLIIAGICIFTIVSSQTAVGAGVYAFAGIGIVFVILGIVLFIANGKKAAEEDEDYEADEYEE